jgi:hypothetical protein
MNSILQTKVIKREMGETFGMQGKGVREFGHSYEDLGGTVSG